MAIPIKKTFFHLLHRRSSQWMKKGNAVMFVFLKELRLELIPNSLWGWASEQLRKKMRSTGAKGTTGCSKPSLNTSLKLVLELTRAVSEDIAWEGMELESWNHKDFSHCSMDHYVRNVEIRSLGRCLVVTSRAVQLWVSYAKHGLGVQISSTVLFMSSLASVRLATSTAFLVRWVKGGCAKARGRKSQGCAWLQESLSYWPLTSITAAAEERSSCRLL